MNSPLSARASEIRTSQDSRVTEANRRLAILEQYDALIAAGKAEWRALHACGLSKTTLWRYRRAVAAAGFPGLIPATAACGRESILLKCSVSPETLAAMRANNLDTNSTTAALRSFAASDACPEPLADAILDPRRTSKHSIPPSIRAAAAVTRPLRDAHNGPRRLALRGMATPRYLDIIPGDIFTSDDTTPIWGWWVPWPASKEYPFGKKTLQGQLLPVMDIASQAVLTYALIAREKSSYRALDIWALFGHAFDTIGLPRLGMQLERGTWESHLIAGEEIEYERGDHTHQRRVGALRQLPSNIHAARLAINEALRDFGPTLRTWTSFLPKSKSIEAFFNRHQTLEGTLYGSLGRDQMRKPYEKAKKIFEACKRGAADPGLHFLSQTELLARLGNIGEYLNNEPIEGEVFHGIPRQRFDTSVNEYPLFHLPEDQRFLYRRNWKTTRVTGGWARIRLTDPETERRYSLFYTHESFARIEGQPIIVYYDRQNFEADAQIILAATGVHHCDARYFDRKGSFLSGDMTGHEIRKMWRNAVMTEYATLLPYIPSRQLPPEIAARRQESVIISGSDSRSVSQSVSRRVSTVEPPVEPPRSNQPPSFRTRQLLEDDDESLSPSAPSAPEPRSLSGLRETVPAPHHHPVN